MKAKLAAIYHRAGRRSPYFAYLEGTPGPTGHRRRVRISGATPAEASRMTIAAYLSA